MTSLHTYLVDRIKRDGYISYDQVREVCDDPKKFFDTNKEKYKLGNAERRLRPSESPDVEPVFKEATEYIMGWKLRGYNLPAEIRSKRELTSDEILQYALL